MFPAQTRIKVCCIASEEEAALAIAMGASAIGLVSRMPSGPGPIPEARIRDIARIVPPGIATFLLTSETTAEPIIAQQRYCGTNTLQLVDEVEPGVHAVLRAALPGIKIVQVIHVRDENAVAEARQVSPQVDALLLDSGNPSLARKELGGTGRAHDWAVSRRIRDGVQVPVYLAGGLNPLNVGKAIAQVQPFGVDVCSGLRTDGRLDAEKLGQFMRAVRESQQKE
ncbi:MAG TPA: phosphoribosylanthranilate isomerase [Gemmatimonadaceae bacterium]|nr:phosphoribosylanthranilate isomerase [Gemmatimonadaceae bacterium]